MLIRFAASLQELVQEEQRRATPPSEIAAALLDLAIIAARFDPATTKATLASMAEAISAAAEKPAALRK